MKRFAIKLTKGDEYRILFICDDKATAMNAGVEFRCNYPRDEGLLSCIEADFDEDGKMSGNGYRLHEVFL